MELFIEGEAPGLFFGYKTQGIIQAEDVVDGKVGYISSDGSTKYYTSSVGNDMAAGNIKCVDVMKMKGRDLYMRDGNIITVGRERFKGVREAILNYWGV